ncbi:MAG: hypothetical protein WBN61_08160 [Woeseiaceae bacterium]
MKLSVSGTARVALVLSVMATAASAQTSQRSLAMPSETLGSLGQKIEFPESSGDMAMFVQCVAEVKESGKVGYNFCLHRDGVDDLAYRKAVTRVMKNAAFAPAVFDGEIKRASWFYRVLFYRQKGAQTVRVYGNWGDDAQTYDLDYEAPQRIRRYKNDGPNISADCSKDGKFIRVKIDESGNVVGKAEVHLIKPDEGGQNRCHLQLTSYYENAVYLPAMDNGVAVPATYTGMAGKWPNAPSRTDY